MSYTNVVFKQNIGRNVNKDEVERARLDDRGSTNNKYSGVSGQISNCRQFDIQTLIKFDTAYQLAVEI